MGAAMPEIKYSEAPVLAALAPSRVGAWLVAAMSLSTLAVLAATPGAAWARILAATWIACAAIEVFHSVLLHRGRRGVTVVRLDRDGAIGLRAGDGRWIEAAVQSASFVAPWLTVIRWRAPSHRFDRALLILPDMLGPEDFRRLRLLLRWL